jgi:peptidyl-prolyl cis-trans isomerase A (cyclophilin A)
MRPTPLGPRRPTRPDRHPRRATFRTLPALALVCVAATAACTARDGGESAAEGNAPDTFSVVFETSAGEFEVEFLRAWSPLAVDRVHELARMGFWEGARIYRVNERYAQFGYSGRPSLDSTWVLDGLPDEPVRTSNVVGTVSFARGGPGSRSTILFVNRTENSNLDDIDWNGVVGFPPVGRVVRGMDAIEALYDGYGDRPMEWEDSIAALGNPFLDRSYPQLDSITDVRLEGGGG